MTLCDIQVIEVVIDRVYVVLLRIADNLTGHALRQEMCLNHISALAIPYQAALTRDDGAGQPPLPLTSNTALMSASTRDDPGNPISPQPWHVRRILWTDLLVRSKQSPS